MAAASSTVIPCGKCGNPNPLGRVFCGACGARLELGNLSQAKTTHRVEPTRVFSWLWQVGVTLLFVLLVVVGISMIPQTTTIGVEGSRSGSAQIAGLTRASRQLLRGQRLGKPVSEADLNGYFRDGAARQMKVDAFSVDIRDGMIRTRMVRTLPGFDVGSWQFRPKASYEVVVIPIGDQVRFGATRKGLLPLFGPFKTAVIRDLYRRVATLEEWQELCGRGLVSDVQAREGAIDLVLER